MLPSGDDGMLVVTANWAIGDGTVHGPPPPGAIAGFVLGVQRAAWRAGFCRDGSYRPIDALQLVLAGDTLDGLVSLEWRGDARPWRVGSRSRLTTEQVAAAALRQAGRALVAIARLVRDGIDVPAADIRSRPSLATSRRVPVTACCLTGDRDRGLESALLAALARRGGVHLGTDWSNGHVVVRHGDASDPLYAWDASVAGRGRLDRPPTLAESLAVDLISPFAATIMGDAGLRSHPETRRRLRRIATSCPRDMPAHVAAWSREASDGVVREAWLRAVRHWHVQARADRPETGVPYDVVDPVASWFETAVFAAGGRAGPHACPAIAEMTARTNVQAVGAAEAGTLVLGHPSAGEMAAGEMAAGERDGRCICLGPRPSPRYGAVVPSALAAAVFPDGGATDAVWLSGEESGQAGRTIVARVGAAGDAPEIVDAA